LFLNEEPLARVPHIAAHLSWLLGHQISETTTKRYLRKMGWSWRVPTRFQIYKYTLANLEYYVDFIEAIRYIPAHKLKFADESHIVSKHLNTRRVLGLKNHRTYLRERTLYDAHASLTVITSFENNPLLIDYRIESNTQWDFADMLLYACESGFLKQGLIVLYFLTL
jgi:hypothetical protein